MIKAQPENNARKRAPKVGGPVDADSLQRFVTRIENVETDEQSLRADKRTVYDQAKAAGHNPKAVRKIVQERKKKTDEELETLLETYRRALGMATYREVAEQFNIPRSTLHRLVPKNGSGTVPRPMEEGDLGEWVAPEKEPTFNIDLSHLKPAEPTAPIISDAEAADNLDAAQARLAELRRAHA